MEVIRKIPNGKLLGVEKLVENSNIKKIKLSGDFFIHPEDKIEELEQKLIGCRTDDVWQIASSVLHDATLVGISIKDLVDLLEESK